jgi:hypothetical protein
VTGSPANPLLVWPFPAPGKLVALAYRELDRAAAGSPEQIRALGDPRLLPPTVGAGELPFPAAAGAIVVCGWKQLSRG